MKIVHSADTGSIEDAGQCFIYDVPDEVTTEELDEWLVQHLEEAQRRLGGHDWPEELDEWLVQHLEDGISITGLLFLRNEMLSGEC